MNLQIQTLPLNQIGELLNKQCDLQTFFTEYCREMTPGSENVSYFGGVCLCLWIGGLIFLEGIADISGG